MKILDFLNLYDNWNGLVTINTLVEAKDDERGKWKRIVNKTKIQDFVAKYQDAAVMENKVIAFGFYDGELCIRV